MNFSLCNRTVNAVRLNARLMASQIPKAFYSTNDSPFDDPGFPRVGLSKDRSTVAMYHPVRNVPYEKTVPIPRDDKRYSAYMTANDIASDKIMEAGISGKSVEYNRPEHFFPMFDRDLPSTANELGKIFGTSKHRWFYHRKPKHWYSQYDELDRPQS